ncbi:MULTISPECIES: hypothetical protein [Burkholderia cepacia complex]|uniref:hypothetical protein n=1 Tax=Burkholderia cepacia complex TaxID=87882 RepID=UPI00158BD27D|nr:MULTISPECIES: hypothetical protein [Burkholderia cepacia complex]MCO8395307.1 hypothetical protein [Burkholderia cenocepacia]MCO8403176.1 hypothetical protein [Burkholderia cenocepacia]MCO8416980.1 hypothetical protein [Burkholderia cenocepacia]MCO8449293.1 hypothetical protein [Burkholderia cenocepacia]MCO8455045.1 hypothetical protein [Burkholderia multivorans]
MKTPTPKQKGIYMTAELYETVILGRHADIQKGRKGQSLNQSLDEVAEDFKNPVVPYIESLGEVYDLLTPIMFQIHGNPKTKSALGKSLWHTLLLMARDKKTGAWIAQVAFANYLALNEVNLAKPFVPLLNSQRDEALILYTALGMGSWSDIEEIAPHFTAKIRLLHQSGFDMNGKFLLSRFGTEKTTIAEELAREIPDEDEDKEMTAYLWILKTCHNYGIDLTKGLKAAQREENTAFNSIVMKFKIDKEAKDKPVVNRVSKDGGKL